MRAEDLIPCFAGILGELSETDGHRALVKEANGIEDFSTDDAGYVLNDLFGALGEYAPDYCYFGACEGDGADYGFWISWKSVDELEALPLDVFDSYVIGIGIVGVAYQNAASKLVDDIPAGRFENHVLYKSVRECSVSSEECSKFFELLSFWQITKKQQVGALLETEPSIFLKSPGYFGDIDASVEKATVHGDTLSLIEDISVHVSNFS